MPELPEVETVKEKLKAVLLNLKIENVTIFYDEIIASEKSAFSKNIIGQTIVDIKRRGKWLLFELEDYYLVSHLRMEGKYFIKDESIEINKHEHIVFHLSSGETLRYHDVRKFGRMYLVKKDQLYTDTPLKKIGLEPFDEGLLSSYLTEKYARLTSPIKTVLLNQEIITGIGNIYADEILFLAKIDPFKYAKELNDKELSLIIENTRKVLSDAIKYGGSTIKSYTSLGEKGEFQDHLLVHGRENKSCTVCETKIKRVKINGRSTYFCTFCQGVEDVH